MPDKRMMKLGLSIRGAGYHVGAWRRPGRAPNAAIDFQNFVEMVQAAESAKLDLVFLADALAAKAIDDPPGAAARSSWNAEFEPITLLSALAPLTRNIGLVATASTSYYEPFHIARKFASLDHISGGRSGWNMVASYSERDAQNFSREKGRDNTERYQRGKEFTEVVMGLWDTWEDDAMVFDQRNGIFYDYDKVHLLNHKGTHFQVKGPLTCPRSPQGRPIVVQAGFSEEGRDIAAEMADLIYTVSENIEDAREFYADMKRRVIAKGRRPKDLLIMPAVTAYIGATEAEAREEYDTFKEFVDPMVSMASVVRRVPGLSGLQLDDVVTERHFEKVIFKSTFNMRRFVVEHKPTFREFLKVYGSGTTDNVVIGSAEQVADRLQEWFEGDACDGFNFTPPDGLADTKRLGAHLVPELQRRGLFRTEYEGTTLRQNLGLSWPRNRFAAERNHAVRGGSSGLPR